MAKNSVLVPVLAGILGVAVVGSGIGYYVVSNNDSAEVSDKEKDGEKKDKKSGNSAVLSVDEVAKNIESQIDRAQKITNGELETGYKGEISYTAPTSGDVASMGIKSVTVGVEAKQKDKMSGMDYTVAYDSKNVLTLDMVVDNESETAYVKIPELSDAYLYGTADEIETFMNESLLGSSSSLYSANPDMSSSFSGDLDDYDLDAEDAFEASAYTDAGAMSVTSAAATNTAPDLDALGSIDYGALFEDLASYADTVKENAPAAADAEDYTVTSGEESITLTTKRYTVTADDAKKIADAVIAKAKADETLKEFFTSAGATEADYNSMFDSFSTEEITGDDVLTVDVYYNGEEVQGINMYDAAEQEQNKIYMVMASDNEKMIVDGSFTEDGTEEMDASGLITIKDKVMNGSVSFSAPNENMSYTITYNGLTATDDAVNGSISVAGSAEGSDFDMTMTLDCKGEDSDITITGSTAGSDIGTVNMKIQQTDASDISIPTGTGYKFTDEAELQKYTEGCDIEGWMATLKDALGEELYNSLFGASGTGTDMSSGMTGYDDDYGYDEDDWSDWQDIDDLEDHDDDHDDLTLGA